MLHPAAPFSIDIASRAARELASPRDQSAALADSAGALLATGAGGFVALAPHLAAVDPLPFARDRNGRGIRPAAIHHPPASPAPWGSGRRCAPQLEIVNL